MVVFGQFFANRAQYIDAFQKILLINAIAIGEIVQRICFVTPRNPLA